MMHLSLDGLLAKVSTASSVFYSQTGSADEVRQHQSYVTILAVRGVSLAISNYDRV
jgi:hypothetical protein